MTLYSSSKESKVWFLLVVFLVKIIWFLSKWQPGQPNGDGTAAYYSTDSQVLDAKETKTGVEGVCVQEFINDFTGKSPSVLS